jgi:prophage regulatory protein
LKQPHVGHAIAISAILVQAPRLVFALLAADRLPVAPSIERVLLVLTGIGTAVVLTGGNLYLAHTVATVRHWRRLLVPVWIVVLAASGALTVPMIAAGLSGRTLPSLLASSATAWGWAVLAAVAHELTAAGCVLAGAAGAAPKPTTEPATSAAEPAWSSAEPAADGQQGIAASLGSAPAGGSANPLLPVRCRAGCGKSFRSTLAEAGHLRHLPCTPRTPNTDQVFNGATGLKEKEEGKQPATVLRCGAVLSRTGLSRATIYRLMASGQFPSQRRLSAGAVGWNEAEVEAWINERFSKPPL